MDTGEKFLIEVTMLSSNKGASLADGAKLLVEKSNNLVRFGGPIAIGNSFMTTNYRLVENRVETKSPSFSAAAFGAAILSSAGFLIGLLF